MNVLATSAWPLDRQDWLELAPMVRRIARISSDAPVRLIETSDGRRTAMARLPSRALVARAVSPVNSISPVSPASSISPVDPVGPIGSREQIIDVTARSGELGRWLDAEDDADTTPARDDASWRGGRPPRDGWQRIERVPADVVLDLVRAGAQAHVDAADQGLGARAVDALLDRPVLTVSDGTSSVEITNRSLSALVGMGFLPDDGHIVVSSSRGWTRVAAQFGSTYVEPRRDGLLVL